MPDDRQHHNPEEITVNPYLRMMERDRYGKQELPDSVFSNLNMWKCSVRTNLQIHTLWALTSIWVMMMTVIRTIINRVYINILYIYRPKCFSFKVDQLNCNEHIQVRVFFFISWLIPFTVRTHRLLLQSEPHVNRNHSHRRVLTMVNSSRENHRSLGSCSEPSA